MKEQVMMTSTGIGRREGIDEIDKKDKKGRKFEKTY